MNAALRSLVAGSLHSSMQAQASALVQRSSLVFHQFTFFFVKPRIVMQLSRCLKFSFQPAGLGGEHSNGTVGLVRPQHREDGLGGGHCHCPCCHLWIGQDCHCSTWGEQERFCLDDQMSNSFQCFLGNANSALFYNILLFS